MERKYKARGSKEGNKHRKRRDPDDYDNPFRFRHYFEENCILVKSFLERMNE